MPPPFPSSSVVDTFNRANGAPGGLWTSSPDAGVAKDFAITSNVLTHSGGGWMYYNLALGGDAEVRIQSPAYTAGDVEVELLFDAGNAAWGGYGFLWGAPNFQLIHYTPSGADTTLADVSGSYGPGDGIGIRKVGATIEGWHTPSGGSPIRIASVTDAAVFTGKSYVPGLYAENAATTLDNFAAGSVPLDEASVGNRRRRRRTD